MPFMDDLEFNTDVENEAYQPPPGLGLAVVTQAVGQLGGYAIAGPVGGMALAPLMIKKTLDLAFAEVRQNHRRQVDDGHR